MLHIAIVEDEQQYSQQLQEYIQRYAQEHELECSVKVFGDGTQVLDQYTGEFDIILLDIEMPQMNGMEAATRIRQMDRDVVLMFVTNMIQYAINGYEVGALDFVLKPVNYYTFSIRFTRAIERARERESGQVLLNMPDRVLRMDTHPICYIEIRDRVLHYHTEIGEFVLRGTMQAVEKELERYHFMRCNHWYLVNLRHVTEIRKDVVVVAGNELEISRRNRTAFLTALTNYIGGNH